MHRPNTQRIYQKLDAECVCIYVYILNLVVTIIRWTYTPYMFSTGGDAQGKTKFLIANIFFFCIVLMTTCNWYHHIEPIDVSSVCQYVRIKLIICASPTFCLRTSIILYIEHVSVFFNPGVGEFCVNLWY